MQFEPSVPIVGVCPEIGVVYADRFARRGHDLVPVMHAAARCRLLAA